jgi:hypothetical protein
MEIKQTPACREYIVWIRDMIDYSKLIPTSFHVLLNYPQI